MITIKEIAALAGTSRGTVDRALKGRAGVNAETKARIDRICREHNYIPNRAGVMLGLSKKQYKVGAVLPSLDNHRFDGLIRGLELAENEYTDFGLRVELYELGDSEREQLAAIDRLKKGGMQALVLFPAQGEALEKRLRALNAEGVGVITLGRDLSPRKAHLSCGWTRCGKVAGELCAALALASSGEFPIAVAGGGSDPGDEERVRSFLEQAERAPAVSVRRVLSLGASEAETAEKLRRTVRNYPDLSALFLCASAASEKTLADLPPNILCVSLGENDLTARAMQKGLLHMTVSEQGEEQGKLALRLIVEGCLNARPLDGAHEAPVVIKNRFGA